MNCLRCFNYVQIDQQVSVKYPNRNKIISFNFLNKYEIVSTWDTLTDTAKVVFPKNIVAKDLQNNDVPLQGSNINIGGDTLNDKGNIDLNNAPLFLRGDKISIQAGYWYEDQFGIEQQYVKLLFTGYINKVMSKLQITLECEDNMWLLKQIPAPDKIWGNNISLQDVFKTCLKGSKFEQAGGTVKTQSNTSISFETGTFYTKGETVAQVLARIKRDLKIGSYMKDLELRIGYPTYYPEDVQNQLRPYQFIFQKNIISDNLQYMRKDDIVMSATAQSFYSEQQTTQTKDGHTKTRQKKLMVFIWADPLTQTFKSKTITDTSQIPVNQAGERFTFFFPFAKSTGELIKLATNELQKKYYTGFKGDFTTFGIPLIPYGDNIILNNPVIPDQNGTYKVKSVTYTGGHGIGIRQQIFLDYKIDVKDLIIKV